MVVDILNGIIGALGFILTAVVSILPNSPFDFEGFDWGPFGLLIGTVFPVGDMFLHMAALTTAFAVYYGIRWILRFIRMIQ